MIRLYLAPMEELTGYVFRQVIDRHFGCIDKYFTPFISPDNRIMKTRSSREIVPSNNEGLNVVPQLLTNDPDLFNEAAKLIASFGYKEININFGCPSNTVASKFKGSGILRAPELMDEFLDGVFNGKDSALISNPGLLISVKTRIGYNDPSDLENIINVLERYPFSEVIVHPRLKKDLYGGTPRMELFDMTCDRLTKDIIYNGDIFAADDHEKLLNKYNGRISAVMIGRGAVQNPGIFRQIRTGQVMTKNELFDFLADLYYSYTKAHGEQNALAKMKEVWSYTVRFIEDEKERARIHKMIIKTKDGATYSDAVTVARRYVLPGSIQ